MGRQQQVLWGAFGSVHRRAQFDFTTKIPMEYLARTVEIALTNNMEHDGAGFVLSPACWAAAAAAAAAEEESNFVAALEELRIIFVDNA